MKIKTLFFYLAISSTVLFGQNPLITNISSRNSLPLNGKWNYIIDPYENGYYDYRYQPFDAAENPWGGYFLDKKPKDKTELIEYSFDNSPTLLVPGDWNSQEEKLFYYEGTIWYRKLFNYKPLNGKRLFVYFGAANYQSDIYLNGKKLGRHTGGFTPFNFEITGLLKENNSLVVKVDNKRLKEGVPTLNTDWWNYGGITRDVKLIEVPAVFIRDYKVQLKNDSPEIIEGFVQLDGEEISGKKINIEIPELSLIKLVSTNEKGYAEFEVKAKKIALWEPSNPKLYNVKISSENDIANDKIGFRTITVSGPDILLNGKSVFLKGICIHEENPMRGGRAYSEEDARMLLGWVKEMNGNFARLAHYPHNENMARVADEMGILLWEEIPVYWTIDWKNETTFNNASNQLTDLITRDKNRASVIIWSVGNETPVHEDRNKFMSDLISKARTLDNSRLVSAALEQHTMKDNNNIRTITDPLADKVDILSFNQYIGWYDGLPDKCGKVTWKIDIQKPVFISEFGAGALEGFYADSLTRFSEEYQEYLYKETIKMLKKIPQFRGMSPWIIADFRSPRRPLPDIQDGWNRKGVISQTGNKKKAFYILKEFYDQNLINE